MSSSLNSPTHAYISRKTEAVINLSHLKANYKNINDFAPNSTTIAVIKADAYGHGALVVAKALESLAPILAVAFIDEAIKLRDAGIDKPILILEGPMSSCDIKKGIDNNFVLMFHSIEQVQWLINYEEKVEGSDKHFNQNLWLKIDTGMHRLGFHPEQVDSIMSQIKSKLSPTNIVLCSHFSSADELENAKTTRQTEHLKQIAKKHQCLMSIANSAGILSWPESHLDFNRLGLALYGATPIEKKSLPFDLHAVMTLTSSVIALREVSVGDSVGYGETWIAKRPSVIATVAIGYADGYPRNAPMNTPTFINGSIAPIAGRVSMDMITVDVTDVADVKIGSRVELWGKHLSVETIAEHVQAINYELITRVSDRVPRVYIS